MPAKFVFEYAVIRVVPRVEREEFINVGVVVFIKSQRFLQCRYHLPTEKLQVLFPQLEPDEVLAHLQSFERICCAHPQGGPIAQLDVASRFRWLTATRSTVVQCSKVHPGFCTDGAQLAERLFEQLVL